MEVEADPPPDRLPCAFCRQKVATAAARVCRRCSTPYHPDCWTANDGRCAVYACEPVAAKPAGPNETVQVPRIVVPSWLARSPWVVWIFLALVWMVFRNMSGERLRTEARSEPLHRSPYPGPQEVPALLREARRLIARALPLLHEGRSPLDPQQRESLRRDLRAALGDLGQAHGIYLRCRWTDPTTGSEEGLAETSTLILSAERRIADLELRRVP